MERILITGGCGFLGSHIVEHLLKNTDADIVIIDKLSYAALGFDRMRAVREGFGEAEFTRRVRMAGSGTDLSQPLQPGVVREVGEVDLIIHAAAESHVDRSISDPAPFLISNVVGTSNILQSAIAERASRILVVSTDEVYGPAAWDSPGANEGAPFRPANPYAASKAGAEAVAMAYRNTYGLPITIVNTMNLIGERQHPEKFVPMVIRKVLAGETVAIHADPGRVRSGTRFYLHCRTFANALYWTWRKFGHRGPGGPLKLHVCGEREISNLDLARLIADIVGLPLHYELVDFHSSRPGHDLRYAMDDSLIQKLGWDRPMGLEASLEKTVRWYLAHREWLVL